MIDIKQGRCVPPFRPLEQLITSVKCRHPLQEQVVDMFVPNDLLLRGGLGEGVAADTEFDSDGRYLGDGESSVNPHGWSIMICTGANACGKVGSADTQEHLVG